MRVSRSSEAEESTDSRFSLLRLMDPDVIAEPHVLYHALRAYEPVHWDPYMHAWIVTSYAEVTTVLMHYSADRTPSLDHLNQLGLSLLKPFAEMMLKQMLFMDPPTHARLRGICSAAFTPRRVEELRSKIENIADDLLDRSIANGQIDLIGDFANPLPAIITAELLGVPIEDHEQLGAWVIDLAEILGNFQHQPDRVAEIVQSLEDLKAYIADKMVEQRKTPKEGLLSSLMAAEIDGQKLSNEEVVANAIITMIGGHETTTNLIASGFLTLMDDPKSMKFLRDHPEIAGSAVEELLRFESPVQHTARIAPADMQLGGKTIVKGSRVVAGLAAANRDPKRFRDPDSLNLTRQDNRHLAFGWASHFCFGAPLARMEGQIAFTKLLARLNNPVLREEKLQWRSNAGLRGLTSLKISFDANLA